VLKLTDQGGVAYKPSDGEGRECHQGCRDKPIGRPGNGRGRCDPRVQLG
jgi:hypothetical protein